MSTVSNTPPGSPDARFRTADGRTITEGLACWDNNLDLVIVKVSESRVDSGWWDGWFETVRPDGQRGPVMNGERLTTVHPFDRTRAADVLAERAPRGWDVIDAGTEPDAPEPAVSRFDSPGLAALRHHVSGAVARGEAEPITAVVANYVARFNAGGIIAALPQFNGSPVPASYVCVVDRGEGTRDRFVVVHSNTVGAEWDWSYLYTDDVTEALDRALAVAGFPSLPERAA
jgi:hypothetical protein